MLFMNEYEIEDACRLYAGSDVLGPATQTLRNLATFANRNSDGWSYWPKPCRAAEQLQRLIHGDGTWDYRTHGVYAVQPEQVRKAYRPIKSFLTRHPGLDGGDSVVVPL